MDNPLLWTTDHSFNISSQGRKKEQQQPWNSASLCLIHFTLKTVCLSAPDFLAAISALCFPPYVFTNNGNSKLFTSQDRGFLVDWTFRTKTKTVLEKNGNLVTETTH